MSVTQDRDLRREPHRYNRNLKVMHCTVTDRKAIAEQCEPAARDRTEGMIAAATVLPLDAERRQPLDRRRRTLHSLLYGGFRPRRRNQRRIGGITSVRDLDWHHPQWLAVAMLIVLFSCLDAALTLTLIEHGAYEVNPLMARLVGDSALAFTAVKIGLTAGGVVLLTLLVRVRAFGRIPVSLLLYMVLGGYGTLIFYEVGLLRELLFPA